MAISNVITSSMLSASTSQGAGVIVTATASTGTTIHASGGNDEVWLWACNMGGVATERALVIEFGSTAASKNFEYGIADDAGLVLVVPGWMLTTGTITAYADSASKVNLFGYVNRIGAF